MSDKNEWPAHARATLQRYFQKRSAPRTIVSLLLILTGFFAFLISYASLRFGLTQMGSDTLSPCSPGLAGWVLETEAPGCHSIGPAIEKILRG